MTAALGLVLGVIVALAAPSAAAEEPAGSVSALEGSAEVRHAGTQAWAPVMAGDDVRLGDELRTGPAAKLKLLLRDDSVLTLAADSRLTIDQEVLGAAATTSTFSLWVGTLRALVTDRYKTTGSRFEVQTPTAVAGVRGTGFIASYDETRKVTLVVGLFDTTCVRSRSGRGGEVCVTPRLATEVPAGRGPSKAAVVDPHRLSGLLGATEILGGGLAPEEELPPAAGRTATDGGAGCRRRRAGDAGPTGRAGDDARRASGRSASTDIETAARHHAHHDSPTSSAAPSPATADRTPTAVSPPPAAATTR